MRTGQRLYRLVSAALERERSSSATRSWRRVRCRARRRIAETRRAWIRLGGDRWGFQVLLTLGMSSAIVSSFALDATTGVARTAEAVYRVMLAASLLWVAGELQRLRRPRDSASDANDDADKDAHLAAKQAPKKSSKSTMPQQDPTWETAARMLAGSTRRLRASEARFRAILSSVVDPLLVLNAAGEIIEISRSSETIFRMSTRDLVGRTLADLAEPEWLDRRRSELDDGLDRASSESVSEIEMCCLRGDGKPFACGLSIARAEPQLVGSILYIVSLHELTERRELQLQLVHAQKMRAIGQLAGGVAHELNTPVQFIGDNLRFLDESVHAMAGLLRGYREVSSTASWPTALEAEWTKLEARCEDADLEFLDAELPEAIRQSLDGVARVSEIVRAMREFSQNGDVKRAEVDIHRAIEATAIVAQHTWRRVADLELGLEASPAVVIGVGSELNQVFLNILLNACQAIRAGQGVESPAKGKIRVETCTEDGWLTIRFIDSGVGISEGVGRRVFEPFYTTRELGEGAGQGLAIAYDVVVQRHGGTIDVESEPGVRTVFTVRLPSGTASARSAETDQAEAGTRDRLEAGVAGGLAGQRP